MGNISKLLSGTAVLIGIYLIITNAGNTSTIINSLGGVYVDGVKALQGKK